MSRRSLLVLLVLFLCFMISGCSPAPEIDIQYDPSSLIFSGERAYAIEEELVTTYPNRTDGSDKLFQASVWVKDRFSAAGWDCSFDDWESVIYSELVPLRNVVCRLPGESDQEILVTAHLDMAPTTIQGANDDASGVAILIHLAEIFAAEGQPRYTLVFVANGAEEYGMLGSLRIIDTHPDTEKIVAGISLDGLGRTYYKDILADQVGQFEGYAPTWIALTAREAALAADLDFQVINKGLIDQVLEQAITISFTDQGPMNAVGIPALGFAGAVPPEKAAEDYRLWHDPDDTMENQSPYALEQSGLITEAFIRQLLTMDSFPRQSGPYLYFEGSRQILSGLPLYLIFIGFVALFVAGALFIGRDSLSGKGRQWLSALPHFLGLWLPLVGSILLLYLFVQIGLMEKFTTYPGTTKDHYQLNPRWPAVIILLLGTAVFFFIGRRLVRRFSGAAPVPEFKHIKSLAFLVITLVGIFLLVRDPFALIFLVPLLFWFLVSGRRGFGRVLDVIMLLLGGLTFYALIYFFGFVTLRYGFGFLWYFISAISIGMFKFVNVAGGAAIIAAGLSMLVNVPKGADRK